MFSPTKLDPSQKCCLAGNDIEIDFSFLLISFQSCFWAWTRKAEHFLSLIKKDNYGSILLRPQMHPQTLASFFDGLQDLSRSITRFSKTKKRKPLRSTFQLPTSGKWGSGSWPCPHPPPPYLWLFRVRNKCNEVVWTELMKRKWNQRSEGNEANEC